MIIILSTGTTVYRATSIYMQLRRYTVNIRLEVLDSGASVSRIVLNSHSIGLVLVLGLDKKQVSYT